MLIREEMHNLAQGIIGAFEARTGGIAYLRGEVGEHRQTAQAHLREMHRNHQAMARRQRGQLAQGRESLQEEVGGYRQGTQVHLREIEATVREHRQATQTQLQGYRDELAGLRDELVGARDEWQHLEAVMQAKRNGVAVGNDSRRGEGAAQGGGRRRSLVSEG